MGKLWISRIMPRFSGEIASKEELERRYSSFSRTLTVILLALVLIPMLVLSLLSYNQYKRLLEEREIEQLLLSVEQAENTVRLFVVKLRSIINFAGYEDRFLELLEPVALEKLFTRLQKTHPDFTDIEVIGPKGHTVAYKGPWAIKDQEYTSQEWYTQVVQQGVYISNIFSGFRGVPHFVVAVSRQMPDGEGRWVMRMNIDGKALQRYVDTVGTTSVDDVFLVDRRMILQTNPKKYGKRGTRSVFSEGGALSERMKTVLASRQKEFGRVAFDIQSSRDGVQVLRVACPVDGTPWQLVMVKERYLYGAKWISFRTRLFTIFFSCGLAAIIIIFQLSRAITNHIREGDRKRQQFLREAENSNKLASIGRLAAGVAHEINNPLAIINQKAGLVEDYMEMTGDFDYKKEMAAALTGIDQSVERCRKITHRLLGFARHTDVHAEEIDINQLLTEVSAFVAREASYSQVQIVFSLAKEPLPIVSDRGQLQQVFLNIINNAIDAIGTNGEIRITTQQQDAGHVLVEIADNGSGMSEETRQRLFEPFYTTKATGKGTGLGLSIVYGIIEKLGGNIKVASELGEGTVFTFVLPIEHQQDGENG